MSMKTLRHSRLFWGGVWGGSALHLPGECPDQSLYCCSVLTSDSHHPPLWPWSSGCSGTCRTHLHNVTAQFPWASFFICIALESSTYDVLQNKCWCLWVFFPVTRCQPNSTTAVCSREHCTDWDCLMFPPFCTFWFHFKMIVWSTWTWQKWIFRCALKVGWLLMCVKSATDLSSCTYVLFCSCDVIWSGSILLQYVDVNMTNYARSLTSCWAVPSAGWIPSGGCRGYTCHLGSASATSWSGWRGRRRKLCRGCRYELPSLWRQRGGGQLDEENVFVCQLDEAQETDGTGWCSLTNIHTVPLFKAFLIT